MTTEATAAPKAVVTIQNWRLVSSGGPFTPPECRGQSLQGEVTGHHRLPDGSRVTTSTVVKVEKRYAWTYSGTVYRLGRISRAQRDLYGKNYDRRNPLD